MLHITCFSSFIWLSAEQFKIKFSMLAVFCSPFVDGIYSTCMVYVEQFRWYYVNIISVQYMNFWLQLPIQFLHIALAVSLVSTHISHISCWASKKKIDWKRPHPKYRYTYNVQATQFPNHKKNIRKKISELECDDFGDTVIWKQTSCMVTTVIQLKEIKKQHRHRWNQPKNENNNSKPFSRFFFIKLNVLQNEPNSVLSESYFHHRFSPIGLGFCFHVWFVSFWQSFVRQIEN